MTYFYASMFHLISLYRQAFSNLQRNVWILAIVMFVNRSGSMVLLFTSLYMTRELQFSLAQAGVVMSCYGIGSVIGSYAGGWLADRKSYFDIMIASLITSGLVLLFLLVVKSLAGIGTVIFLYAFTADIFRPSNSKAIAIFSDPANRTRSVSLVRLAINLGFSLGPAIGGFVALYLGYKWLFLIDALTTFLATGILFIYLPKQKAATITKKNAVLDDSKTSAYRDFRYLVFIFLVALYGTCFFQIFASVPQYFNQICHYNEDTIGLLLALNGLLVVLIEMPLILALEKKGEKIFPYIIAGALCLPISFAILLLGKNLLIWSLAYTLIISFSEILAMPFMMNYALSRPPKERQGQYSALYSISYGLANIAAPVLGLGIAAKYGFTTMFYFLIVLSSITAIGFLLLNQKHKKENVPL